MIQIYEQYIFERADLLNLFFQHFVFMDDILENVEAARRAGINAFVFENQEQAKQMLRTFGVD